MRSLGFAVGVAALLAVAIGVFSVACGGSGRAKIVVAVQPSSSASELSADAGEIEQFLEERVDADIEISIPTQYSTVIEALRFGHADAAFMGAWPAALATQEANAEIVLAEIREVMIDGELNEAPFYYSYYVVPSDTEITSLDELEGMRVAFPSQISTSGYVAPVARLVELGLIDEPAEGEQADPEQFFGQVIFSGGYAQSWEALQAGQVDVTVIAGDVPADLFDEVLAGTRVIEQQGPVPSHAVVFSNDFEGELRDDLKAALLELGQPDYRDLMRRFISGIFVRFEETTSEEHLARLSDYLDLTGFEFAEAPANPNPEPDPEPEESQEATPEPDPDPEGGGATPEPDPDPAGA